MKKHKKFFIAMIFVISISCILISVGQRYQPTVVNNALGFIIKPLDSAVTAISSWIGEKVDFVIRMGAIEAENRMLREQVETLTAEAVRLNLIDKENEKLSQLLELNRKYSNYPMVGANVIANDPGNWYNTFVIDKGTQDGIEKDMAVLSSGGLIGRVFEVGYNYAKVRTIIDDTSSVSAKSSRTEDIGTLRGDMNLMYESKCRMDFLDAESEIMEGDEIVTSHISSVYPPGIIIGYVLEISTAANGTKCAIVKPFADFKHIETVLVITQKNERDFMEYGAEE